jgi:Lon protease-like protein
MVSHCRAGSGFMGIATLKPGYESQYDGRPGVWPEVGVGRIVSWRGLDDGRSDIVLAYVGRGIILEELPPREMFREVRLRLRSEVPPDGASVYDDVRRLVMDVGRFSNEAEKEAHRLVNLEGSVLVDTLARRLLADVNEMRRYLAEDRVAERARQVLAALAEVLASAQPQVGEA